MTNEERDNIIKGTKCAPCCDSGWCWNALNSARDACLGPFKDFKDFQDKFRTSNSEGKVTEKERAKSRSKHVREVKLQQFRENRMLCDLLSTTEDTNDTE